ncbi:hypothetical protein C8K36_102352 [Rhodococcus sp. OK519]|uniref:hypothetical protein n=1 Tax=Rhodococcus sp. OK519 TaxID=2135729 RepID=UPI000D3ADFA6|nr:hypothetical protein C8K36_102352 [Rhodococcus sp. OK519]
MSDESETARRARANRARLDAVFGTVLPDQTSDERSRDGESRGDGDGGQDDWLRRQVPPHHG